MAVTMMATLYSRFALLKYTTRYYLYKTRYFPADDVIH